MKVAIIGKIEKFKYKFVTEISFLFNSNNFFCREH